MNVRDDLKAYLDGELAPEDALRVERALTENPELAEEAQAMKQISQALQDLGEATALPSRNPDALIQRIRRPRFAPARWQWAAGVVIVFGMVALLQLPRWSLRSPASGGASVEMPATSESARMEVPEDSLSLTDAAESVDKSRNLAIVPGENRLALSLVRTAEVQVQVANLGLAVQGVELVATRFGGFISASQTQGSRTENPTAQLTLRVPVRSFAKALAEVQALGEVVYANSNTQDVSTEVADVDARLRVLRAEEQATISILQAATKVGEIMAVRERLSIIRQQIESLEAQQRTLRDQTSFSTIRVSLAQRVQVGEPPASNHWGGEAWSNAVNGLAAVGRALGVAAINVFVYAPIWLPLVLIAWWWNRRRR